MKYTEIFLYIELIFISFFTNLSYRTALAEAELEYDDTFISPSLYVRFCLTNLPSSISRCLNQSENVYAIIWTTTPWTLPSNQAICYNAKLLYSLIRFRSDQKLYLLANSLLEDFQKNTNIDYELIQNIPGKFSNFPLFLINYKDL